MINIYVNSHANLHNVCYQNRRFPPRKQPTVEVETVESRGTGAQAEYLNEIRSRNLIGDCWYMMAPTLAVFSNKQNSYSDSYVWEWFHDGS